MKGSTTRWTTAIAAAALLGVPAAAIAQPPAQPPQTQTTTSQPPTTSSQPPTTTSEPPTSSQPATSTAGTEQQPPAQPAGQADTSVAKKALSDARDTLAQLASMPEAAKLQGEQRTQVSQLISNFNELITNTTDWRSSYTKVSGTLTTLLGPENTDAQATAAQTPAVPTPTTGAAGTPGAVGTAGTATTQLDPAIRAKLVEMKNNLAEFEKASGGMSK